MSRRIIALILLALIASHVSHAAAADVDLHAAGGGLTTQNLEHDQVLRLGSRPTDVVFTIDGSKAFVSMHEQGEVLVFDPADWSEIDRVVTGGEPVAMDVVHDGSVVLVAIRGTGEVIEISTSTHEIVGRLDLSDLLETDQLRDVFEVGDNDVLVTGRRVVRYDRTDPTTARRVASGDTFRGGVIHADRGGRLAVIAESGNPNSLSVLNLNWPSARVVAEDAHGTISGAIWGTIDEPRNRIYLGSGQVLALDNVTEIDHLGGNGYPALSSDGTKLYWWWGSDMKIFDAESLELIDTFKRSCPYFDDVNSIQGSHLDPTETYMVHRYQRGLCLEPLDGSGKSPVRVRFVLNPRVSDCCLDQPRWIVVDENFQIVSEHERVTEFEIGLVPGEYGVVVGNMTDSRGWPYAPVWHDGSPLLTRSDPTLLTIDSARTVTIDVWPYFYDIVDAAETFWDAIAWLQQTGITTGCNATAYCPNDYVTRGQMAAFLDRALDLPTGGPSGFSDDGGTFQQNIWNLRAAGITTGCSSTRYCTDDYVTRGQMAAFLDRALGLPTGPDAGFSDDDGTFRQNIWNLKFAGITTGCSQTQYCTDDYVTRQQMAAFLFRALAEDWPFV